MRPFLNLFQPSARRGPRSEARYFRAAVENTFGRLSTNRGNILVYIVMVMVIFAALGAAMLSMFSTASSSSATANHNRRAFNLYESGYRYALSELTDAGFSSSSITALNTTTYSVPPNGQFLLNVFGNWFERTGPPAPRLCAGESLNLRVPRGKLPSGFAIPAGVPHVSVVNFEYTGPFISDPDSSAEVTGYSYTDPTHFSLTVGTVGDCFVANPNERICLAVHPDQNQTVSDGGNLTVALQARDIFPKFNGAIKVKSERLFYRERVDDPINLKTNLTHLKAKSGSFTSFPVTVADYVILSPGNYYIVPEGRSGGVTYGASMDYAVSAYNGATSGSSGSSGSEGGRADFESDEQVDAGKELSTVLSKTEFGSGFAGVDDAGRKVTFQRTSGTPFASVFFKDTRAIGGQNGFCQNGRCLFNDGIRAFFVMTFTGVGDGFTFSLLSAEPNPLDGNSLNNTASSVGGDFELGELLGYAGDSRTDNTPTYLDGTGNGLRPPKLAVEFDGYYNNKPVAYCADATTINTGTRFDPEFSGSGRDTVQYVFWGSRNPITAPCRANKASYDDNRHDVKDPIAEQQWPFPTFTAEVRSKPAVSPSDGTIYVGSGSPGINDGRAFAINPDGTQKWVFNSPGSGETEFKSSPALDSNGRIYIGSNDNHLYCLNPANGNQIWSTPSSGNVKSGPAIDEARNRVYVGSDNKFYAINKTTGGIIWTYPASTTHTFASPTIDPVDGTIYVGSSADLLYALNPDMTLKWQYPSSGTIGTIEGAPRISTEPLAANRKIYFGSNDNKIHAVNRSGAPQWTRLTGGDVVTTPALTPDNLTVYAGSLDGFLYALNSSNGTIKWKYPPGATGLAAVSSSPAIDSDGTVYFGTDGGILYAVNPDGTLKWTFPASGSVGAIRSSPTIGPNGIIYVGSDDGKVYAIDPFVDPRNIRNLYLTAAELGETQSDNWFELGTWAVRVEVDRSQSPNANGKYEYTLRTWMRKCTDTVNCSDIAGTLYANTRLRYNYKPLSLTLLPMTQTIELAGTDHTLFNRFLFGFTSGSGSNQTINISKFQLSFIRPNDLVVTADPNWP